MASKSSLLVVVLLLITHSPWARPGTVHLLCNTFREGHFTHRFIDSEDSGYSFSFHIIRKGNRQLEINDRTSDTSSYKIVWLGECTYELQLMYTTLKLSTEEFQLRSSVPLKTTIIDRGKGFYIFTAQRAAGEISSTDTIWVRK